MEKTIILREVLKKDYEINYNDFEDVEKIFLKEMSYATNYEKEMFLSYFKFNYCVVLIFNDTEFWTNKKENFKDFFYKNFLEKDFDFLNYDKNVLNEIKEYFKAACEKLSSWLKKLSQFENEKFLKDAEEIVNFRFKDFIFQLNLKKAGQGEKNNLNESFIEKIKKDFKNKKSDLFKAFVKDTKKFLIYTKNGYFKWSIKNIERFEKDENFRKKVSKIIKEIYNLKDYYNIVGNAVDFTTKCCRKINF